MRKRLIPILTAVYLIALCAYMISHRMWFSPDQFFIFAVLGALAIGRSKAFIKDWGPFLILFLGYEFLRGLVPLISNNVHIMPMINADNFIFGFIPTIKFQQWWYDPNHLRWYDYVAVTFYIMHFVTPMVVGYLLWLKDRHYFRKYTTGLILLSYAAFLTYIAYPAMPPWMASSKGYLPQIHEVTGVVMSHFLPNKLSLPSVYSFMRPNPVAAIPSLHAAFPLIIFWFVFRKSKKASLLIVPYVLGVWFAVIYLGEHYFIDVVIGAIYATAAFLIVDRWYNVAYTS